MSHLSTIWPKEPEAVSTTACPACSVQIRPVVRPGKPLVPAFRSSWSGSASSQTNFGKQRVLASAGCWWSGF